MELLLFYLCAVTAVFGGVVLLVHKNPLYGALALVLTLCATSALFAMLSAYFAAVMQIMVYAGAIMVLFMFVIMLFNLKEEEWGFRRLSLVKTTGLLAGIAVGVRIGSLIADAPAQATAFAKALPANAGTADRAAVLFFGDQLFAFQLVGPLLLVAMIGAVVLTRKRI